MVNLKGNGFFWITSLVALSFAVFFGSCGGTPGELETAGPETERVLSEEFCNDLFASAPHIDDLIKKEGKDTADRISPKNGDEGSEYEGNETYGNGEEGDESYSGLHNQGENCMTCHSRGSGNEGEEYLFTVAGTVFKNLRGMSNSLTEPAEGYTVELITKSCVSVIARKGRGVGNFYMYYVLSEDFIPFVVDGSGRRVNRASAVHGKERGACNSCHTREGKNGAPGRIVSYDYYGKLTQGSQKEGSHQGEKQQFGKPSVSFKNDVHPILTQKCMGCHTEGGQAGGTRYKLTGNAGTDYETIMNAGLVVAGNPSESLLLLKPSGKVSHGGGTVIQEGSEEYRKIENWIKEGAKNN